MRPALVLDHGGRVGRPSHLARAAQLNAPLWVTRRSRLSVQGLTGDGAVRTAVDRDKDRSGARDAAANDAPVDPYVALARASVEGFMRTGNRIAVPDGLPPELSDKRAGVFVSLHEHGELRGCIGTISPVTGSTAAEIVRNGVAAASEDPRFPPVRPDELDALSYSVDVLFTPMPVESID